MGAFYLLYFFTVRESTVGTAAILLYSSPAFVALLTWVFLKDALGALRLLALVLTFGGIFLVVGAYDAATLEVSPLVLAMGLLSGLTVQSVLYFRQTCGWTPRIRRYTELRFGFRAILLLIAALPTFYTLVGLSLSPYTLLFALAVVHTALTFGLYTARLKRLDAGQAAIVATVEPVVVGAIGVVLLGEELTALKVIGALLVLAGTALAQVRLEKASRGNTVPEEHSRLR